MEKVTLKLNAPKAIKARSYINRKTKSDFIINHSPLIDEYEDNCMKFSTITKEINRFDEISIKNDFDELSIKSEIFTILNNNEKYNNKNSNCSRSTAMSSKNFSNDLSQDEDFEKLSLPPLRVKNPFSHNLNENNLNDEDTNYHINFSKFLKKN